MATMAAPNTAETPNFTNNALSTVAENAAEPAESIESRENIHLDEAPETSTHDFQPQRELALRTPEPLSQHANGTATPPGRRSVQFARDMDTADLKQNGSADAGAPETPSSDIIGPHRQRERLKQRMRSFGLSTKPPGHFRSRSAMSVSGDIGFGVSPVSATDRDTQGDTTDGEMGDTSVPPSPAPFTFSKRKRKPPPPDWSPTTEPNTPMEGSFTQNDRLSNSQSPIRRLRPRPIRRATMTDVPEGTREGMSEDEGRARLAQGGNWKRRSSAWLQNAQGQSFIKARRASRQENTPEKSKLSNLRRMRKAGAATDTEDHPRSNWLKKGDPKERLRKLTQDKLINALRIGRKRKAERGVDYIKSAELVAELLAGSPAAVILASHFQPDELYKKKVPVLLEQVKVKITDKQKPKENTDRHARFRIELEYGNGLVRMEWVIWRSVMDFYRLHLKYTSSNITDWRKKNSASGRQKKPRFPAKAFPWLKNMAGVNLAEEDEDEPEKSGKDESGSGNEATPQEPRRPAINAQRRKSSHYHTRSQSTGRRGVGGLLSRTNTGVDAGEAAKGDYEDYQRRELEKYLRGLLRTFMFRGGSNRLCKFLEISALGLNLAVEGGYHGKEGKMYSKKPGKFAFLHKWYLIRESYIVCVESPEDTILLDVFLVDPDFKFTARRPRIRDQKTAKEMAKTAKAKSGKISSSHRLKFENKERRVTLFAKDERHQEQWAQSINFMWKNTLWAQKHRFDSFAPVRKDVHAEWLVDARDYMWKVSRAIDQAENCIFIHDWWLSPELYMRRPPVISRKWRLDRLLQRKARQGVKIFIIMYRNINSAIPIDSEYSKEALLDLHPNIFVQRSPNQARQQVFFWAHHEKICIVDHIVGFCGGVDLCFGRWDTPDHRLTDDKMTGFEPTEFPRDADHCQMWPGKDYSNPRVQDFFDLVNPYGEMYDRNKTPRMPWHDIGMQVVGQPARDLARHFIQRWNYLHRQRTARGRGNLSRPLPVLLPPPDLDPAEVQALGFDGTCDIQMLRSCGEWSMGTPGKIERSIQNAYIKLIEASDHFIYIENQFFVTSCFVENAQISNQIGDALVERIIRASRNSERWSAVICIPLMPGFESQVHEQDGTSVRLIMECQYRSICRGEKSIFGRLRAEGIDPLQYINFYSLRQWGKIGPEKHLTTEQLYIHAKCMIVDDRAVVIGSANINERSMNGDRDSEVAAIVQDKYMLDSTMAGVEYKVGRFAHTLRIRLMREHIGVDVDALRGEGGEDYLTSSLRDPLAPEFLRDTWHKTAAENTRLYRQVFRSMPDSEVTTWDEYKVAFEFEGPGRAGEGKEGKGMDYGAAEELLKQVQGHVVCFPYDWLRAENWLFSIDTMAPLEIYN